MYQDIGEKENYEHLGILEAQMLINPIGKSAYIDCVEVPERVTNENTNTDIK